MHSALHAEALDYRIFLLSIHDFGRICVERFNGIPDLLFYNAQTEIEEILGGEKPVLLLRLIGESSEVVGLIGCGESDSKSWCLEKLNHMLGELERRLSLSGNIGLSDSESGLAKISSAFRQARGALLRGNINDASRVFTINDTAQAEPVRIGVNDQQLSILFRTGQLDEMMLYINSLIAELVKRRAYSLRNLELVFLDLLNLLNALLRSQDLPSIASSDSEAKRVLRDIWQHATCPELVEKDIREYLEPFVDQFSAHSINSLLTDMCAYIDQHYPERVGLSTLSERFYISREYVSRIFKKGLHTTFVNYLTEVRLRHVCRLLLTSNHSISQIADETGFKEAGYMIRVFKKTYGVTPKEYRVSR
jgi:two-component system response regulator YesN